jgi:hypothetical protein
MLVLEEAYMDLGYSVVGLFLRIRLAMFDVCRGHHGNVGRGVLVINVISIGDVNVTSDWKQFNVSVAHDTVRDWIKEGEGLLTQLMTSEGNQGVASGFNRLFTRFEVSPE